MCVSNPCERVNYVPFNKGCHELDKPGPCPVPELDNKIGVNETTLEIICTKGFNLSTRFSSIPSSTASPSSTSTATTTTIEPEITVGQATYYNKRECFIGGKRWTLEECPQQVFEKEKIDAIFNPIFSKP